MSTADLIFKQAGRRFNYTNVNANATKDEILQVNSRESFSSINSWPDESPIASYYDITNTDTKLILLNNHSARSHLRGQTRTKSAHNRTKMANGTDSTPADEQEQHKQQHFKHYQSDLNLHKYQQPDPERHFMRMSCTHRPEFDDPTTMSNHVYTNKGSWTSSDTDRPPDRKTTTSSVNDDLRYYLYFMNKMKVGYQGSNPQACGKMISAPKEYRQSVNINHPDLTKGDKLYIYDQCRVYSVKALKKRKQRAYMDLLEQRLKTGLHKHEDPTKYANYIMDKTKRQIPPVNLNLGYFKPNESIIMKSRPKTAKKASSKQVKSSKPNESDDVQINMIARRIEDFWPSSDSKRTKPDDTTMIKDESSKSDDVESGLLLHDNIDDNNQERVAYGDLHRPKTRLSNVKTDRIKINSSSASSMSSFVSA